jgi:proteasome accessory factor B
MQPLERLVNLVALLLDARRPLTFDQLRERMPEAYEQDDLDTAKRMFERDKDLLRDIGVPIELVATDAWDAEQGYTILKDAYYLPAIAFTPEEISALFVAAHAARGDSTAEEAVRKLLSGTEGGILAGVLPTQLAVEGEAADTRLAAAGEAVAEHRRIRFAYRTARGAGSERTVDAYGLVIRGGHWYVVGLDRDRDEVRAFRLSRLGSELTDVGPGSEPPEGFVAAEHVQAGPWGPGEPQERATVAFSPAVAWWAPKGVQGAEEVRVRDDGWTEASVPTGVGEGLASWILSFGPDAEAVDPPELRAEVLRRLEAVLAD